MKKPTKLNFHGVTVMLTPTPDYYTYFSTSKIMRNNNLMVAIRPNVYDIIVNKTDLVNMLAHDYDIRRNVDGKDWRIEFKNDEDLMVFLLKTSSM
jgi:hypothetical protein